MMAYYNCGVRELHVPIMVIVDYMGFRLIAMSVLPVSRDTLIYGTADAGRTVHNDSAEFASLMARAANRLNIGKHYCGAGRQRQLLHSAADVEGHLGTDNRFYLLDFSRTFPPVRPDLSIHNGHLYQLFRAEFCATYHTALCSDSFSGFVREDPSRALYSRQVKAATNYLERIVVAKALSHELSPAIEHAAASSDAALRDLSLPTIVHKWGVNLRLLGLMLDPEHAAATRTACLVIFIEVLARALKNEVRLQLRNKMRQLKVPLLAPYRQLIVDVFNSIFGRRELSRQFWRKMVPQIAASFYVRHWSLAGTDSRRDDDDSNAQPIGASDSFDWSKSGATSSESMPSMTVASGASSSSSSSSSSLPLSSISSPSSLAASPSSTTTFASAREQAMTAAARAKRARKMSEADVDEALECVFGVLGIDEPIGCSTMTPRFLLFVKLAELAQLEFSDALVKKMRSSRAAAMPDELFHIVDLREFNVRVKHGTAVTNAAGMFWFGRAKEMLKDPSRASEARDAFVHARTKFEQALRSDPANKEALLNAAATCLKLVEFDSKGGAAMATVDFSPSDPAIRLVDQYYERAIRGDPRDPLPKYTYAKFLLRCRLYRLAEHHYLSALEHDYNSVRLLRGYAMFLLELNHADGEALLRRASACNNLEIEVEQKLLRQQQPTIVG
jgi:Clustered mitochondria